MKGRHLIEIGDLTTEEVGRILDASAKIKAEVRRGDFVGRLANKTLAMIFEKPSARTRMSFEVGMNQMGGSAMYIAKDEIKMGVRESVPDVARTTSRFADLIMIRTFKHETLTEFARFSASPVINGLTDYNHPCQALGDLFTVKEKFGDLSGVTIAFIGDANNVARSLAMICVKLGVSMRLCGPQGYGFGEDFLAHLGGLAEFKEGLVTAVADPGEAVSGAKVVYTDVWASMGQEAEAEERKKRFAPYQVNGELMKKAAKGAVVMHCLPARRGEEVTDDVLDSKRSIVFDQAENRMHAQKGIMALLAGALV